MHSIISVCRFHGIFFVGHRAEKIHVSDFCGFFIFFNQLGGTDIAWLTGAIEIEVDGQFYELNKVLTGQVSFDSTTKEKISNEVFQTFRINTGWKTKSEIQWLAEIINSDQGGHFTNPDYVSLIEGSGVRISMDGKGQCLDNARTERFFRTLKYDRVYINEYTTPRDIRQMLNAYIPHYNTARPHTSADGLPPATRYMLQRGCAA